MYPKHIDKEDWPEQSPENLPEEIVELAVETCSEYRACPECGHEQWVYKKPGWNARWNCNNCDAEMTVVG